MPPFHAAGPIGIFENDLRLTDAEIDRIVSWADDGALRGSVSVAEIDPISEIQPELAQEPDFFIEFPDYRIPADHEDPDPYVFLYSETVIDEDLWISGYEWQFSDYRVVHHAASRMIRASDPTPVSGVADRPLGPRELASGFASWFPGQSAMMYPDGVASLLPAGTRILATMHYSPLSEATVDRPRIGIFLFSGPLQNRFQYKSVSVRNEGLRIPPGVERHRVHAESEIHIDARIYSYHAHMHYRGKSVRLWKKFQDGRSELLFEVPKYDFDWQRTYILADPILLPAGTNLEAEFVWDNSSRNPDNPDPTAEVTFGPSSYDEMGGIRIGLANVSRGVDVSSAPVLTAGRVVSGEVPDESAKRGIELALESMSEDERNAAIKKALERMSPEKLKQLLEAHL